MNVLLTLFTFTVVSIVGHAVTADSNQKHWALLVAGSRGYGNYRHQADVCHAYHIMRKHGIPDERIVVMMYDDIAQNEQNPFPGNIINKPNGSNVYPGVLKDYTGSDVNAEVFLKVLTGDSTGVEKLLGRKGKVIKSGPQDTVFVNFVDHGAPGLVSFPNDVLHAKQLIAALESMHKNNQYKEMVLYIEACESGSMFEKLRSDINIFATTAANADESSYATYFDKIRFTYLGDLYSVNWMEDSDSKDLNKETLLNQFKIVEKKTNKSHVKKFGNMSMANRFVGQFQGNKLDMSAKPKRLSKIIGQNPNIGAVPADNVETEILFRKYLAAVDADQEDKKQMYEAEISRVFSKRSEIKRMFEFITQMVKPDLSSEDLLNKHVKFSDYSCYMHSVDTLIKLCPSPQLTNDYFAMKHLRVLANLCEIASIEKVLKAVKTVTTQSSFCNQ